MSLIYACEKVLQAAECLVTEGTLAERLYGAAMYLTRVQADHVPEDLQHEFAEVNWKLTRDEPTGTEGSIQATIATMTAEEQRQVALDILKLFRRTVKLDPIDY